MAFRFKNLLEWLAEQMGQPAVVRAVRNAIDRCRVKKHPAMDMETFLNFTGLKGPLGASVNFRKGKVKNFEKLTRVLRRLNIKAEDLFNLDMETRFAPWDAWTQDAVVLVVLGGKSAIIPEARSNFRRPVVGAPDAKAYARLIQILREDAEIDFRDELHFLPPECQGAEAEAYLKKLRKRKNVGAIVVLGSPLVNPLADPIARRIFQGSMARDLPARFRWSFKRRQEDPFLCDPKQFKPTQEGIALPGHQLTTFPRIRDEDVVKNMRQGPRGTYPDTGILCISSMNDILLILCAGHGGCGTMAAVLGLSKVMYVEKQLLDSSVPELPTHVMCEPVWVKRRKQTKEPIDDFYFNERLYGVEWGFHWDDEDEADDEDENIGMAAPTPLPSSLKTFRSTRRLAGKKNAKMDEGSLVGDKP